jgi:hypothetical protein
LEYGTTEGDEMNPTIESLDKIAQQLNKKCAELEYIKAHGFPLHFKTFKDFEIAAEDYCRDCGWSPPGE